jgi:uncharacterized protein (TIGR00369 family)
MSENPTESVPEGFEPVPQGLGYTDTLQPLYRRFDGESVIFGLRISPHHSNTMGICHGGVMMTLADIAAASGVNLARGAVAGAPTVNLSLDFISAAPIGHWLQAETQLVQTKRRFGFCSGILRADEVLVARFNGTFYFPDHDGMWKNRKKSPGPLGGLGDGV